MSKGPYHVIVLSVVASLTSFITINLMDRHLYAATTDSTTSLSTALSGLKPTISYSDSDCTWSYLGGTNSGTQDPYSSQAYSLARFPTNMNSSTLEFYGNRAKNGGIFYIVASPRNQNTWPLGVLADTNWGGWRMLNLSCDNSPAASNGATQVMVAAWPMMDMGLFKTAASDQSNKMINSFAFSMAVKCCTLKVKWT